MKVVFYSSYKTFRVDNMRHFVPFLVLTNNDYLYTIREKGGAKKIRYNYKVLIKKEKKSDKENINEKSERFCNALRINNHLVRPASLRSRTNS